MKETNVIQYINDIYPNLTKSEKKIADFILKNYIDAQYMSITSLADECSVADATISRFCKTLGYQSYSAFKLALAKNTDDVASSINKTSNNTVTIEDSIIEMANKLYSTDIIAMKQSLDLINPETISQTVRYFHNAHNVYCFGQGGGGIIAKEAWSRFITATSHFRYIEDSHMQVIASSLCTPNDVILFFSYSGATTDVIDILSKAKERGAIIILVTHYPKSPAASYSNIVLLCGSQENPLNSGSIAVRMAQLFIIDVLFNEFCRMDLIHTSQNRETTSEALARKQL